MVAAAADAAERISTGLPCAVEPLLAGARAIRSVNPA
jgi:hypothetical protein